MLSDIVDLTDRDAVIAGSSRAMGLIAPRPRRAPLAQLNAALNQSLTPSRCAHAVAPSIPDIDSPDSGYSYYRTMFNYPTGIPAG